MVIYLDGQQELSGKSRNKSKDLLKYKSRLRLHIKLEVTLVTEKEYRNGLVITSYPTLNVFY